ncbi:hypothetical protein BT67DRAFT_13222 [Trichocladium antarcticum]|uniref:Uncharacterized protein n=1 Tax=Trichocladium antarcticum TaxID=1450529 RepID=A0AAN6UT23_9PEZI|nr:hypothetical protein BT67DRAFT_13222 [Trichocladium antarcticum]
MNSQSTGYDIYTDVPGKACRFCDVVDTDLSLSQAINSTSRAQIFVDVLSVDGDGFIRGQRLPCRDSALCKARHHRLGGPLPRIGSRVPMTHPISKLHPLFCILPRTPVSPTQRLHSALHNDTKRIPSHLSHHQRLVLQAVLSGLPTHTPTASLDPDPLPPRPAKRKRKACALLLSAPVSAAWSCSKMGIALRVGGPLFNRHEHPPSE